MPSKLSPADVDYVFGYTRYSELRLALSELPPEFQEHFERIRQLRFWGQHDGLLDLLVEEKVSAFKKLKDVDTLEKAVLQSTGGSFPDPYLLIMERESTLGVFGVDPARFPDVETLLSPTAKKSLQSCPPVLDFVNLEMGDEVEQETEDFVASTRCAFAQGPLKPELELVMQTIVMSGVLNGQGQNTNLKCRRALGKPTTVSDKPVQGESTPAHPMTHVVSTSAKKGWVGETEHLVMTRTLKMPSGQDFMAFRLLAPNVEFEQGFGAFVKELARESGLSLLQVTLCLVRSPVFKALAHATDALVAQPASVFLDVDSLRDEWRISPREDDSLRTVLQATRLLFEKGASFDPHLAAILDTLRTSGRESKLASLLLSVWTSMENSDLWWLKGDLPKASQLMNLIFGRTKRVGSRSSVTTRTILLPAWTEGGVKHDDALPDQSRLALSLQRARDFSEKLCLMRGYQLPKPLQLKVVEGGEAMLLETDELQVPSSLLLGPFVHVEELIRWVHFGILSREYLGVSQSADEAQQRAAARTGMVLSDWLKMQKDRLSVQDLTADPLADRSSAEQRLMEKAEKLFRLGNSDNESEAALAMERAHELLEKLRYETLHADLETEKSAAHERVFSQKKARDDLGCALKSMRTLTYFIGNRREARVANSILGLVSCNYGVEVVYRSVYDSATGASKDGADVMGSKASLLMAEHVIDFLCRQTEGMWNSAREKVGFQNREKVSFKLGVIEGFSRKLEKQQALAKAGRASAGSDREALIALAEDATEAYRDLRYNNLKSKTTRGYSIYGGAYNKGQSEGGQLSVHTPLENASSASRSPAGQRALIEGAPTH